MIEEPALPPDLEELEKNLRACIAVPERVAMLLNYPKSVLYVLGMQQRRKNAGKIENKGKPNVVVGRHFTGRTLANRFLQLLGLDL